MRHEVQVPIRGETQKRGKGAEDERHRHTAAPEATEAGARAGRGEHDPLGRRKRRLSRRPDRAAGRGDRAAPPDPARRRAAPRAAARPRREGLSLPRRARPRDRPAPTCSAGTTRCSPISGCTAPSASGRARCAPRSSARSTFPRPTSSSASRSRSSAARRSRASSPSPASAAGAISSSTRPSATISAATGALRWPTATKARRCSSGARDGDEVRLFWAAEGGPETADPGFDPHLAPDPTPLWNMLDWTPEGRGPDWYPKLEY